MLLILVLSILGSLELLEDTRGSAGIRLAGVKSRLSSILRSVKPCRYSTPPYSRPTPFIFAGKQNATLISWKQSPNREDAPLSLSLSRATGGGGGTAVAGAEGRWQHNKSLPLSNQMQSYLWD
jgi:hypothetical protein